MKARIEAGRNRTYPPMFDQADEHKAKRMFEYAMKAKLDKPASCQFFL
jgi:hypothetical protein